VVKTGGIAGMCRPRARDEPPPEGGYHRGVSQTIPSESTGAEAAAGERYLLLADISGYTGFMAGVEEEHGVDFSAGIPAAYAVLGDLLDAVVEGLRPDLALVKLEGDAVFAAAPAAGLDSQGDRVLDTIHSTYRSFIDARTRAIPANDHVCIACPAVAHLDLKAVLHRGQSVRQAVGSGSDLLGPAVTVAHRLLKNTVRDRIGARPYLFMTDAAATALGVPGIGLTHREQYTDAGQIGGRIVELGGQSR
jgi:class 3 adenylate cyclase